MHKWLALAGLVVIAVPFCYLVFCGIRCRQTKLLYLGRHHAAARATLWALALGVILIETAVWLKPIDHRSALLWVHLPLAVSFVVLLLLLQFRFHGLRSRLHGPLAYVCTAVFAGMLGTGTALWLRM